MLFMDTAARLKPPSSEHRIKSGSPASRNAKNQAIESIGTAGYARQADGIPLLKEEELCAQ